MSAVSLLPHGHNGVGIREIMVKASRKIASIGMSCDSLLCSAGEVDYDRLSFGEHSLYS